MEALPLPASLSASARARFALCLAVPLVAAACLTARADEQPLPDDPAPEALQAYRETLRSGDLDQMIRNRQVRALAMMRSLCPS
jgi:hypothetical protein